MAASAEHARFHCCVAGKSTSKTREPGKGIAIGEGIEARAEDDVLRDAAGDGIRRAGLQRSGCARP